MSNEFPIGPAPQQLTNNFKTEEYIKDEEEKTQDELARVADLIQEKMDESNEPTNKINNKKRERIVRYNARHYKLHPLQPP